MDIKTRLKKETECAIDMEDVAPESKLSEKDLLKKISDAHTLMYNQEANDIDRFVELSKNIVIKFSDDKGESKAPAKV